MLPQFYPFLICFIALCNFLHLDGSTIEETPLLFSGRFMPTSTYSIEFQKLNENHPFDNKTPILTQLFHHHFQLSNALNENDLYEQRFKQLKNSRYAPSEIKKTLEREFPIFERLKQAGETFLAIPSLLNHETWFSLNALKIKTYDEKTNTLMPIKNFSPYPDEVFNKIRTHYFQLEMDLKNDKMLNASSLADSLLEGYSLLAKKISTQAQKKTRFFPSFTQLKAENFLNKTPVVLFFLSSYFFCFLFLLFLKKRFIPYTFFVTVLILHTLYLLLRSYILLRPPVSNMVETALFVPWIASLVSLFFAFFFKTTLPLLCSCFASSLLFGILYFNNIYPSLENVQAVLDSQLWLTIHVLMIVGSYGIFILSGCLGHYYIFLASSKKEHTQKLKLIGQLIKQSMYAGLLLLIPGTILGGVWAARSWGRFWDWDPKESWAFITACAYLAWVHAHYFGLIKDFGLAIGSIVGLMTVAFTWYGVNYILGTGLHSYGFGSGGVKYFYFYLFLEIFILAYISKKWQNKETLKI